MGIDARTDVYHGDDRVGRIYYYVGIGTARRVHTVTRSIYMYVHYVHDDEKKIITIIIRASVIIVPHFRG
jgi:hypothetical protein